MTAGECAGTRAFVDRSPRKATLRAIGDATVYMLTRRRSIPWWMATRAWLTK